MDVIEDCHHCARNADERSAQPPAEREDAVAVDADERDRARILARRLQRPPEIGAADDDVERREADAGEEATEELRQRQEDAAEIERVPGKPARLDAAIIGGEEMLGEAADGDAE